MEWSDEKILQLISSYESHPVLWNPQHVNYKLNNRKLDAWKRISDSMDVSVTELKKKMASLMASYRRERSRVLRKGYVDNIDITNDSKWFAYKAFSFLNDIYRPKLVLNQDQVVDSSDFMEFDYSSIIKSEIQEPEELEVCYTAQDEDSNVLSLLTQEGQIPLTNNQQALENERRNTVYNRRRLNAKRKFRNYDRISTAVCKLAKKIGSDHENRDECKVYGEYISHKLRNYDFQTRSIVQHHINNIIFDADMGKYLINCSNTIPENIKCQNNNQAISNSKIPNESEITS